MNRGWKKLNLCIVKFDMLHATGLAIAQRMFNLACVICSFVPRTLEHHRIKYIPKDPLIGPNPKKNSFKGDSRVDREPLLSGGGHI